MLSKADPTPKTIDGITVRKSKKARRVTLRVHPRTQDIELVVPTRVSVAWAMDFARSQTAWIEKQRAKKTDIIPLSDHDAKALKKEARAVLTAMIHDKIKLLPEKPNTRPLSPLQSLFDFMAPTPKWERDIKIRIGDPKTLWGSCHPDGRISLSWRLMLAPEHARDYVVAHEVAHLVHNNHSKRFWDLCEKLSNDYMGGKKWIKDHGQSLHRYVSGIESPQTPEE